MKDTPFIYRGLKAEIEKAKSLLPGLSQSDIDRVFSNAKPHDITKFTINAAYGLSNHNQDAAALNILSIAKFCLLNAVYHNYLVHKSYCTDKILECEAKIKVHHHYPRQAAATQNNQTIQYATAKTLPSQVTDHSSTDNSTLMMNQMMMAAVANQVIQNSESHCHDHANNDNNCPTSSTDTHHHDGHHSHHHDDSNYSSTYTQPNTSHDTSSYHSSIGGGSDSQHVDHSSVYHSGTTIFDHGSTHDYSSSTHDYSSSSNNDYSSSSCDTSSNNDYSSNSYSM